MPNQLVIVAYQDSPDAKKLAIWMGAIMMDEAKMTGMTLALLTFRGR